MKKTRSSKQLLFLILSITFALIGIALAVSQLPKQQLLRPKAVGNYPSSFVGMVLSPNSDYAKGSSQAMTITSSIWTGTGGPDIPSGTYLLIGISMVGTGDISITDAHQNQYTLIKKQPIDDLSGVYVFGSILTSNIKAYDSITVTSTSAKSMVISGAGYRNVSGVAHVAGNAGYNNLPQSPAFYAPQSIPVFIVAGFRAKQGDFSISYPPVVQYVSGGNSGKTGNSTDNSVLVTYGFINNNAQTYTLPIVISKMKNRSGYHWGTIAITLE